MLFDAGFSMGARGRQWQTLESANPRLLGAQRACRLAMKDGATLLAANPPSPSRIMTEGVCLDSLHYARRESFLGGSGKRLLILWGAPCRPRSANLALAFLLLLGAGVAQTSDP